MNLDEKINLYKALNHPLLSVSIFNQIFEIPSRQKTNEYSEVKIDKAKPTLTHTYLGLIKIKDTEFFTQLEIEKQLDAIIKNIITSNIISKEDLQQQICELYNKEILNVILPPDSKELKFPMAIRFYEDVQILIKFSTIKD